MKKIVNGIEIECTPEEVLLIENIWEIDRVKKLEEDALYGHCKKRALEYPSVNDQLDMIYQDQMDGTTKWRDLITEIKLNNPKPNK